MPYLFTPPPAPYLPIAGSAAVFPVHRIYCIGRNYAEHVKEMRATMGADTEPVFFQKPADAIVPGGGDIPYPPATHELHHEVELVAALGAGGSGLDRRAARDTIFGYAVGLDLTRRDLQARAKSKGLPWDAAKAFDHAAPISIVHPASVVGHPARARLSLAVNGERRQDGDIADMLLPVADIIVALSNLFELRAGDLVFTGTPAGVGPLVPGDRFEAKLADFARVDGRIIGAPGLD